MGLPRRIVKHFLTYLSLLSFEESITHFHPKVTLKDMDTPILIKYGRDAWDSCFIVMEEYRHLDFDNVTRRPHGTPCVCDCLLSKVR